MNPCEITMVDEETGGIGARVPAEETPLPCEGTWRADPWVVRTPSGEIYAALSKTDAHLWRSADGGRTWSDEGKMGFDPARNGDISRLTVLADGGFLITYTISELDTTGDHYVRSDLYVARSEDKGQTWQPAHPLDPSPYGMCGGESAGKIVQLSDGTVLLPVMLFSGSLEESAHALFLYRSTDGGRTWGDRTRLCFFGAETSLLQLHSGRLMAAVRYQRQVLPTDPPELQAKGGWVYKHVFLADSEDAGRTWGNWRPGTTQFGDTPGELIQLSDGRVLLLWCHRYPYPEGNIRAKVSHDEGRTWEPRIYFVSHGAGYPASLVLEDDVMLTLCGNSVLQADGFAPENGRWTAHAVRWRLPE